MKYQYLGCQIKHDKPEAIVGIDPSVDFDKTAWIYSAPTGEWDRVVTGTIYRSGGAGDATIQLPTSMTFTTFNKEMEEILRNTSDDWTPYIPTVVGFNRHKCEWKSYVGFTESYDYCDCGAKK